MAYQVARGASASQANGTRDACSVHNLNLTVREWRLRATLGVMPRPLCVMMLFVMSNLGHGYSRKPPPRTTEHFARLVDRICMSNTTLLDYFFPAARTPRAVDNWVTHTEKCVYSHDCYCGHVRGSKDKSSNPIDNLLKLDRTVGGACESTGARNLMKRTIQRTTCTPAKLAKVCNCWTGRGSPCLYSDMKPPTSITIMSVARAAGVDHIIEEGREGGLSAFIYAHHGFRVTSVEYLPEDEPTAALRQMAPGVTIVDGDGSKLIPRMVHDMTPSEAARTMVIFDGEKRVQAHRTFKEIRDKIAFAAFDDSEVPEFRAYLQAEGEVWFETELNATRRFEELLDKWRSVPIEAKRGSPTGTRAIQHRSHTTLVRGGGWRPVMA